MYCIINKSKLGPIQEILSGNMEFLSSPKMVHFKLGQIAIWYTLKYVGFGERERETERICISCTMNVNFLSKKIL